MRNMRFELSLMIIAIASFGLYGCAKNPDISKKENNSLSESSESKIKELPAFNLIREFGECLGQCPVYEISIFEDGKVIYIGKKNVRIIGERVKMIDVGKIVKLINEFKNAKFLDFEDSYTRKENCSKIILSDGTYIKISFKSESKVKTVLHYDGCRGTKFFDKLFSLENSIDETANTNEWIK